MTGIFACPHRTKDDLNFDLLSLLYKLEIILRRILKCSSGVRCPECNEKVGGVKNSAHLRGLAVDIHCANSQERYELLTILVKLGIHRIGVGSDFLHIDIDQSLPQRVVWLYT